VTSCYTTDQTKLAQIKLEIAQQKRQKKIFKDYDNGTRYWTFLTAISKF